MIIKRTIKFSLQTQRNAESRLRMRVSYDGKRLDFQTGIILDKSNWDDAQQRVILFNSSAALANDLNDKLSLMLVNMVSIFRDFELRNVMPTTAELRYAYKYQNTPKPQEVATPPEKDIYDVSNKLIDDKIKPRLFPHIGKVSVYIRRRYTIDN